MGRGHRDMLWCRITLLSAAAFFAGCVSPAATVCADDFTCPAGTVCVSGPDGSQCVSPGQLAACEGLIDGDSCNLTGVGDGQCRDGLCIVVGCGDGVLDSGEICDDGNNDSGDGCRADCQSDETCGNAIVDTAAGESCEDENQNPADGCDVCVATEWIAGSIIGRESPATSASLGGPSGVAVDDLGNVFIADTDNHRVRRVDGATGVITTVAGDGTLGFSGDGGAATSAQLRSPRSVAVDGLGNLFIADRVDLRIRRVDGATGVITTVAGDGTFGFSGDGDVATSAQFRSPSGVAVDGLGNLFIADTNDHRIRRVDGATGVITTIAGNGTLGFSGDGLAATNAELRSPSGVAVDGLGHVFIADTSNRRVRRIDGATGIITTVAGDGTFGSGDDVPATSTGLNLPSDVAVDGLGHLLIADTSNRRIRRVDGATGIITTVAGDGSAGSSGDGGAATSAELFSPRSVAVDGLGHVFIADSFTNHIRRVDGATGIITTVAGDGTSGFSGDGGAATSARLNLPARVAIDGLGHVFIADNLNHRIRRVDGATGVITTVAGSGTSGFAGDGDVATSAQLRSPDGVAVDGLGHVFIADTDNHRVRRVDGATGVITTVAGDGISGLIGDGGAATSAQLRSPMSVAVDGLGNLFIADREGQRIRRVDGATGIITRVAGGGGQGFSGDGGAATSAQLALPSGVAVDGLGNVFIADTANHRIRRVDGATGVITTVAGNGTSGFAGDGGAATSAQLDSPRDVAVVGLGHLFIVGAENRVRRVDGVTGIITTIAGDGAPSFSGDGGAATSAWINGPGGVAIDGLGDVFIADSLNHRIRRVDGATGVITTVAGDVDPPGAGPIAQASLANPRGMAFWPEGALFAGGPSGRLQTTRDADGVLETVAGRYPQPTAIAALARFRDSDFGTVAGVAYDPTLGVIYVTERFDDPSDPDVCSPGQCNSRHRVHVVTPVDVGDSHTWTIAALAGRFPEFCEGLGCGAPGDALFRNPTDLFLDDAARVLYVADTGNHVLRAVDLSSGIGSVSVSTFAGTPETLGFFGDGGLRGEAKLFEPGAFTRCANGDFFISDTGNNRVRRIEAGTGIITTVLGDGVAASSGEGSPANTFPVNAPLGLSCDGFGNLFVTSTTTIRFLPADDAGIVDGSGPVQTIHVGGPGETFTDVAVIDDVSIWITESTEGQLIELFRQPACETDHCLLGGPDRRIEAE